MCDFPLFPKSIGGGALLVKSGNFKPDRSTGTVRDAIDYMAGVRSLLFFVCGLGALCVKHITLPLVVAMFVREWGWRKGMLRTFAAGLLWLLTFAVVLAPDTLQAFIDRVLRYQSWAGHYGVSLVLPNGLSTILLYAVAFGGIPLLIARWKPPLALTMRLAAAAFLVFTPGFYPTMMGIWFAWSILTPNAVTAAAIAITTFIMLVTDTSADRGMQNALWILMVVELIVLWRTQAPKRSAAHSESWNRNPR